MESTSLSEFEYRVATDWLPSFCGAPHRNYSTLGFKKESIRNLTEHDAHWFLRSIDLGHVHELDGFFVAPLSKAKEQIFWQGPKNIEPRPITLWVEPVITIGALAKLCGIYKWPIEKLGTQSKTWAFDLVGYGENPDDEILACEVKKSVKEIDTLIELMRAYSYENLIEEPPSGKERNAYKKVMGIRRTWPTIFWALGPNDYSKVYEIVRTGDHEFDLIERGEELLHITALNKQKQVDA